MPNVHADTRAVRAELEARSVLPREEARQGLGDFGPLLSRISEQVARIQGLIARARMTEQEEAVRQKYNALSRACQSVQNRHDKLQDGLMNMEDALRALDAAETELRREIERVEQDLDRQPDV